MLAILISQAAPYCICSCKQQGFCSSSNWTYWFWATLKCKDSSSYFNFFLDSGVVTCKLWLQSLLKLGKYFFCWSPVWEVPYPEKSLAKRSVSFGVFFKIILQLGPGLIIRSIACFWIFQTVQLYQWKYRFFPHQ